MVNVLTGWLDWACIKATTVEESDTPGEKGSQGNVRNHALGNRIAQQSVQGLHGILFAAVERHCLTLFNNRLRRPVTARRERWNCSVPDQLMRMDPGWSFQISLYIV